LTRGGEALGDDEHTKTVGEPVDDAMVKILVTAPDGQKVAGQLQPIGDGKYSIALQSHLIGNYNVTVIASDYDAANQNYNNSEYMITTEHSFYISPEEEPTENSPKYYIYLAWQQLNTIMNTYCPNPPQECDLDNKTKRDISDARSLINTALGYFLNDNHLKTNKGLTFYDKITSAVNDIYPYLDDPDLENNIDLALSYLIEGSYKLAVIVRDEAEEPGACHVSNCEELLKNANSELGKAIDESKQNNYVYIFNHLTNAWKFAMNVMGANLHKENSGEEGNSSIPTEYGLDQNYPNPFNPSTTINYQLPEKNHVSLQIYDILGNLITTLVDQEMEPGFHSIAWNASGLASGVYIYRLISGSFISSKKLILMR